MPTYTVTFPRSPGVPVIGTDEVDAIAGALQSTGSLRDVIALAADTVPEMADVCRRAAPRAPDPQPGPEAAAVRAVVAWWHAQHPEIVVVEANPWTLAATDPTRWHEISRAKSDELLSTLPPIDFTGGFAVSEAIRHEGGSAVYLCVVNARGRWWVRESTLAGVGAAVRDLRSAA
jgi:hypothetical protein